MNKKKELKYIIDNGDCGAMSDVNCDSCPVSTTCSRDEEDESINTRIVIEAQKQLDEIELDEQIEEFLKGD